MLVSGIVGPGCPDNVRNFSLHIPLRASPRLPSQASSPQTSHSALRLLCSLGPGEKSLLFNDSWESSGQCSNWLDLFVFFSTNQSLWPGLACSDWPFFGSHALPVLPEDRVSPLISCVESEACMGSQSRMWKLLLDIVRGNGCLREISGNILYIYIYIFFFFFASAFPKSVQFSSVQSLSCVRLLAKYFFELLERNPKVLRMKFGHKRGLALFQADNGFLCYPFQVWFPF